MVSNKQTGTRQVSIIILLIMAVGGILVALLPTPIVQNVLAQDREAIQEEVTHKGISFSYAPSLAKNISLQRLLYQEDSSGFGMTGMAFPFPNQLAFLKVSGITVILLPLLVLGVRRWGNPIDQKKR